MPHHVPPSGWNLEAPFEYYWYTLYISTTVSCCTKAYYYQQCALNQALAESLRRLTAGISSSWYGSSLGPQCQSWSQSEPWINHPANASSNSISVSQSSCEPNDESMFLCLCLTTAGGSISSSMPLGGNGKILLIFSFCNKYPRFSRFFKVRLRYRRFSSGRNHYQGVSVWLFWLAPHDSSVALKNTHTQVAFSNLGRQILYYAAVCSSLLPGKRLQTCPSRFFLLFRAVSAATKGLIKKEHRVTSASDL